MSEDITPEALPENVSQTLEGGEGTASTNEGKPIREVLSSMLGKDFKTDEAALKAVKDTFNYVGGVGQVKETISKLKQVWNLTDEQAVIKRMEEITQQPTSQPSKDVTAEVAELRARLDEKEFYSDNPDLKPYAPLLNELRGSTGKPLKDVAESEAFKSVYEKARLADETAKTRSVLESNPRLGKVRDKMSEARKALGEGNHEVARANAVGAVMDLMNE